MILHCGPAGLSSPSYRHLQMTMSALCNLQWFYTNTARNVACSFPAGFLHKDIDEFVQLSCPSSPS